MTITNKKTIAIFGAGPGLGAALAERFGREGYRVALVARRPAPLEQRVAALAKAGVEAAAFPADLTKLDALPDLVRTVEQKLGPIDVAVYMPLAPETGFIPAVELDAAKLRPLAELFTFAPIQLAHTLLPGLSARGGAFVYGNGTSSFVTMPGFSGLGPAMAAARNYVFTLNAEAKGVFAGVVTIGAVIEGSAGHTALAASGKLAHMPVISAETIAQNVWTLVTERSRAEVVLPHG